MRYRPDSIGFEPPQELLAKAIKVVEEVHSNIDHEEWTELPTNALRNASKNRLGCRLKKKEQIVLFKWAEANNFLIPSGPFNKAWVAGGRRGETENEVYHDETLEGWWKRNDLAYHDTYLSFFQRIALHNHQFPEVPLELKGFMVDENRAIPDGGKMLKPVLFQPNIEAERGATQEEVESFMASIGYQHVGGFDYYNPELHIRIEDLHDENVFYRDGELFIIDPVIFLDWKGKKHRLAGSLEQLADSCTPSRFAFLLENKENVPKPDDLKDIMSSVGLGKDGDGFYCYTHRARSESYADPHDIPESVIKFIGSTG